MAMTRARAMALSQKAIHWRRVMGVSPAFSAWGRDDTAAQVTMALWSKVVAFLLRQFYHTARCAVQIDFSKVACKSDEGVDE